MKPWQQITIAPDRSHHLYNGERLYSQRFAEVLKYHAPGLAPVIDTTGAYHIDMQGEPAYGFRFSKTYGFYEGLAAVHSQEGWYHITEDGKALSSERYGWCGNFQEGCCSVRLSQGHFFHIDRKGDPLYKEHYRYVGDFKDGIAVVLCDNGTHTHINQEGLFIHDQRFSDLDVYHKGFARAKDARGWFHIDRSGQAIYTQRYASVEPYYNDVARVETPEGALLRIDPSGTVIEEIRQKTEHSLFALSGDMVGFWKTETLRAAVSLGVPDALPGTTEEVARKLHMTEDKTRRILRALWELGIVQPMERWELTPKGQLLKPTNAAPMAFAAKMWAQLNGPIWKKLPDALSCQEDKTHLSFKHHENDPIRLQEYMEVIDCYANEDYQTAGKMIDLEGVDSVIATSRPGFALLNSLIKASPHLKGILLEEEKFLRGAQTSPQIEVIPHAITSQWPCCADIICLPRVMHLWPDEEAKMILKHAVNALNQGGAIYLFELLLDESHPGASLLDLNMLVETGGRERTLNHWKALLNHCNLNLTSVLQISGMNHILKVEKRS